MGACAKIAKGYPSTTEFIQLPFTQKFLEVSPMFTLLCLSSLKRSYKQKCQHIGLCFFIGSASSHRQQVLKNQVSEQGGNTLYSSLTLLGVMFLNSAIERRFLKSFAFCLYWGGQRSMLLIIDLVGVCIDRFRLGLLLLSIDSITTEPYSFNFIMKRKQNKNKQTDNPQIDLSFTHQNNYLDQQQNRLNVEILRVHTIEKQHLVQQYFRMTQQQLCNSFTSYQLFPQQYVRLEELLDSPNLKLIKSEGKIYFGQVERKKREGWGINIYKEGKVYEGEWSCNQKNGQGIEIYPNGNLYIGSFKDNKKHGKGQFFWFNLSSRNPKQDNFVEYYEGQWWGGLPDGFGVHQKINGDMFSGNFKNGLKHGEGVEYFGNGDYYKGQYVNGLPEGYGEYRWKDSSFYKGDFKQGLRNGYGFWQLQKKRNQKYRGHYCMDKKSGYGVYEWENGWNYKGNFDNDYRNGFGELYNEDGELTYRGYWANGQQTEREVQATNHPHQIRNDFNFNINKSSQMQRSQTKKSRLTDRYNNEATHQTQSKTRRSSKNQNYYNKNVERNDLIDYATMSHFDYNMLTSRPQSYTGVNRITDKGKRPSTYKSSRMKEENNLVGTKLNRPLMRNNVKGNLFVPFRTLKNS